MEMPLARRASVRFAAARAATTSIPVRRKPRSTGTGLRAHVVAAAALLSLVAACKDDGTPPPVVAPGQGPQISLGPLSGSTKDVTV